MVFKGDKINHVKLGVEDASDLKWQVGTHLAEIDSIRVGQDQLTLMNDAGKV